MNDMPEGPEYFKLQSRLEPYWSGRKIGLFFIPRGNKTTKEMAQKFPKNVPWSTFSSLVRAAPLGRIQRVGKNLIIPIEQRNYSWHIQLNSTGWWMPTHSEAIAAFTFEFLHPVNDGSVRLAMEFNDGQIWFYHDARTWGKWYLREGTVAREMDYFKKVGPDWLEEPDAATRALLAIKTQRQVKDVLCDQGVTAGLGNYLACEIAWRAKVHPHSTWNTLSVRDITTVTLEAYSFTRECCNTANHSHWGVFDRKGEPCPVCSTPIEYAKDGSHRGIEKRGSYFCRGCQGESICSSSGASTVG